MEQVGTDDEDVLGAWRQGLAERRGLFEAVRAPMRQAASQGIGSITASAPDPHDVDDVVADAFLELERQDPALVRSLVGFARRIAFRRGQDVGRKIIREREGMRELAVHLSVTADPQFHDEDVRLAAEQEVLIGRALECLKGLTEEQRDVVRATIMGRETLSDWALRVGKAHQVASRQRARALKALLHCVRAKGLLNRGGGDDEQG
jgi:DNA-directed RNA polymerase specialized sigma24 family protein